MNKPTPSLLAAGLVLVGAQLDAQSFGFADIPVAHFIGTGANQSGFVIDFNDGATTERYLFAYRWDGAVGDVTGAEMFDAIATAIPELSYTLTSGSVAENFFLNTVTFDTQSGTTGDFVTNFDYWGYFIAGGTADGDPIPGAEVQIPDVVGSSDVGAGALSFGSPGRFIENNSWDVWSFGPFQSSYVVPEPSSYGLLAGLVAFSWIGLRRRRG
jgi:hypothetical protein